MANDNHEIVLVNKTIDQIDFSDFVEESVGNPPWWGPELHCSKCDAVMGDRQFKCKEHEDAPLKGNTFYGAVIDFQAAEGENGFSRYLIQSQCEQTVNQGSRENGELVTVMPGDFFSVSDYAGLPLDRFFGLSVLVQTQRKSMIDTKKNGRVPFWTFVVKVDKSTKKLLETQRTELGRMAAAAHRANKAKSLPGANLITNPPALTNGQPQTA